MEFQATFQTREAARMAKLGELQTKYRISNDNIARLRTCEGTTEYIIIVDNSAGTNQKIIDPPKDNPLAIIPTKFHEMGNRLCAAIVDIAGVIDTNGIETHFVNPVLPTMVNPITGGTIVRNVVNACQLSPYFESTPYGDTPLERVFVAAVEEKLKTMDASQRLVVIIATDGEPTKKDKRGIAVPACDEFEKMLSKKNSRVFVSFVACTNNKTQVAYMTRLDKKIVGVDSNESFESEAVEVKKHSHVELSYGDYIVKILCGSFDKTLDKLDDKKWYQFS